MPQWFVYLIPSLVLLIILVATKVFNAFGKETPYDLVACSGLSETVIGTGGGVAKVGDKLVFVETYGVRLDRGRKVLVVKYIPEKEIYMVEPYI